MNEEYGDTLKKIIFKDTAKRQAEFKIKIKEDNITQSQFFRLCLTAYLGDDSRMSELVDLYKTLNKKQSKVQRRKLKKSKEEGKTTKNRFGLSEKDVENFYSTLELEVDA